MAKYFVVLLTVLSICSCCHKAPEGPKKAFYIGEAIPCTVQVREAKRAAGGSGAVIMNRPGFPLTILTARHVILPHTAQLARFEGGKPFSVAVMHEDARSDLAILMGPSPAKRGCEFTLASPAKRGDKVYAIGWPPSSWMQSTSGNVSAVIRWNKPGQRKRAYLTSALGGAGWSGGPLLNSRGNLIGIGWASLTDVVRLGAIRFRIRRPGGCMYTHTDEIVRFLAETLYARKDL